MSTHTTPAAPSQSDVDLAEIVLTPGSAITALLVLLRWPGTTGIAAWLVILAVLTLTRIAVLRAGGRVSLAAGCIAFGWFIPFVVVLTEVRS